MSRAKRIWYALVRAVPPSAGEKFNLRAWFIWFVLWLVALAAAGRWGHEQVEHDGGRLGWAVWVFSIYAFYLSLCCNFIPLPTTWIVLVAAGDMVAAQLGIADHLVLRIVATATVGSLATGMANLNEYHVFTFLLRYNKVAHVRDTRLYRKAEEWFEDNPFWVIVLFSLVPIPVDVVRWLAITCRYPRGRYFAAYFLGRWCRYALWAMTAIGLSLSTRDIALVQAGLVVLLAVRLTPKFIRHLRASRAARAAGQTPQVVTDVRTT